MNYRSLFRASLIVFVLLGVVSSAALAAQSGPGTSTGTGQVFFPNPVASLQDQSLTDQKDANYAALQPAYKIVTLTNLDGSGYLRGDWANIHGETGNDTFSATNTFIFTRDDERFEQVMGYYWVTEAQKYIQSLGFGTTRRPINMELIIPIPGISTMSCVSAKAVWTMLRTPKLFCMSMVMPFRIHK
ncbi:MAG TPA: hypothetical protein VKB04_00315 [Anaerolineales bacterium]|nr:hypothetical protein [Anaerolineales bacterium]